MLQQLMKQKIDDFGGIEVLTKDLERLRAFTDEKKWFDNMIFYFNSLYTQIVNVEQYAVEYHQASVDTIEFLNDFNKTRKEATIKFLTDLIAFKLDYVAGVRHIS